MLPSVNSRINSRNGIFEEIFNTLKNGNDLESLRYASSLLHYYLASMRFLKLYRNGQHAAPNTDLIAASMHFMKENIGRKLTLQEMADYTGYTPNHFSTIFKSKTSVSPIKYFNSLKIKHACHLLTDTDMNINQICYQVGIDDCFYFSRLFKTEMGISPKQYKEQKAGKK